MTGGSVDVEDYIADLSSAQQAVLADLRETLRALLPDADERMSYGMPGFWRGKMIAGYAGFKAHCGFYPHSGTVIPKFAAELDALGFKHSKSGVMFVPDHPLPVELVARIVAVRQSEVAGTDVR